jgi:hypothetical protein
MPRPYDNGRGIAGGFARLRADSPSFTLLRDASKRLVFGA